MFNRPKKDERTALEIEIESVIKQMSRYEPSMAEYTTCSENLERLYKAKATGPKSEFNWAPIIAGGIGLAEIALIMIFEKTDVLSTKALGFVMKGRV